MDGLCPFLFATLQNRAVLGASRAGKAGDGGASGLTSNRAVVCAVSAFYKPDCSTALRMEVVNEGLR
jgi:hypothetical protein